MSRPGPHRTPSTNLGAGGQERTLEGKLGIVTGGSRGIGAAIAGKLASQGCNLVLNYTSESSKEKAEELEKTLQDKYGVQIVLAQADLATTKGPGYIIEIAKSHFSHPKTGNFQIDIIVNNAGVASVVMLQDVTLEKFEFEYNINVRGPMLLVQAAQQYLPKDKSGRIVNISSVSATFCPPGQTTYAGTKAALDAMTRVWARELAASCTVNSLNPGPVDTEMFAATDESFKQSLSALQQVTPLAQAVKGVDSEHELEQQSKYKGRFARPAEIADLVAMLCSRESSWCTGSVICANGGLVMSR